MRILVIEDYQPLRAAVVAAIGATGSAVDASGNGDEGAWYAKVNAYDLIVLDLCLPGIDGMEVLRRMRTEGSQAHVLITSAKDTLADRVAGLDAGADDYLAKPYAVEELLARIRALVRRKYQRKQPVLEIADLRIDTVTHEIRRGGDLIDLTPREYALLELLAHRSGELVTRQDIRERIYDFRTDLGSNVIDVYIGYLRRKLEDGGRSRLLHTKRGHGYRLGEQP